MNIEKTAQSFKELFYGTLEPSMFWFCVACFIAGFVVFHTITVSKAVKENKESPNKFDFWYWVNDNFRAITLFIVMSYVLVRFPNEIIEYAGGGDLISSHTGSPFVFLIIGFLYEKILVAIRKKAFKENDQN